MRVHAVFRLLEHQRVLRLHDLVRALQTALGGQAVHELALRPRLFHERAVDLEPVERGIPGLALLLLPRVHGRPHVPVDHIRAPHRLVGVVLDFDGAHPRGLRPRDELGIRLEALRAAAHEVDRVDGGELQPGVHDVVPVAHVDDFFVFDLPERLLDGERVRHDLARVVEVSEPVHHRHRPVRREVQHVLVRKRARHHDVVEPRQHARDVARLLAAAEADVVRTEVDGVPAEQVEARLERHARAQGRLGEDHAQRLALERAEGPIAGGELGLDLGRAVQQVLNFGLVKVVDGDERGRGGLVALGHGLRAGRGRSGEG